MAGSENCDPQDFLETHKLIPIFLISSKPIMRVRFQHKMEREGKCLSKEDTLKKSQEFSDQQKLREHIQKC